MIQVDHLSRFYGQHQAVADVSFDIDYGQIVGLLGHNGAGKTTIMRLLAASLEPNQGQVHVDGVNIHQFPKRLHHILGYLPENLPVYDEMAVLDYLHYVCQLKAVPNHKIAAEISRALQLTYLTKRAGDKIAVLSRGYRQRVGVAQAILNQPKLLILDEPTNGLDPHQAQQMRVLIRSIAKEATVILSTHIMQEVSLLCEQVLILKAGRLMLDQPLSQLSESTTLVLKAHLEKTKIEAALKSLDIIFSSIKLVDQKDQCFTYHLHYEIPTDQGFDHDSLSNQVIQRIMQLAPEALLGCYRLERDLETVFKEVNQLDA